MKINKKQNKELTENEIGIILDELECSDNLVRKKQIRIIIEKLTKQGEKRFGWK